jgi:hypothetical protein
MEFERQAYLPYNINDFLLTGTGAGNVYRNAGLYQWKRREK